MSLFNKKEDANLKNLAGGKAYKEDYEMQFVVILLTSFMKDKFYEDSKTTIERIKFLISKCDKEFCAKAIVYARREFGMRSVTHVAASLLAKHISKEKWAKDFFYSVVYRVDDITEIIAFHLSNNEKISNAMKKGFGMAFSKFDKYQIAKYKSGNGKVKLVDVVNLTHPKYSEKNGDAIKLLVEGSLVCTEIWESMLTKAGSDVDAKIKVWETLLSENKLGYMALLRNVRNIVSLNNKELNEMCFKALVNKDAIHKSLVLPFRFIRAYQELKDISSEAISYISEACEIACDNVPKFDGNTLVALDSSGSMSCYGISEIASLFAAAFVKTNKCDIITFSDDASYLQVNWNDSLITIQDKLNFCAGGTNFTKIFECANKKYDRIIILSDMQSWMDYCSPKTAYEMYKKKFGIEQCRVYSIDLAGYGTLQLPQQDVYCIAGFSEKIFDIMKNIEVGLDALLDKIKAVNLRYN